MLARRLPGLLPPLDQDEALEVTQVFSAAGLLGPGAGLISIRPFRAPHHAISVPGLVGGGQVPRPGEVSLANLNVLSIESSCEGWVGLEARGMSTRHPHVVPRAEASRPAVHLVAPSAGCRQPVRPGPVRGGGRTPARCLPGRARTAGIAPGRQAGPGIARSRPDQPAPQAVAHAARPG
jgi:magnesium chelatase subunit ChlI-like protein